MWKKRIARTVAVSAPRPTTVVLPLIAGGFGVIVMPEMDPIAPEPVQSDHVAGERAAAAWSARHATRATRRADMRAMVSLANDWFDTKGSRCASRQKMC